MNETPAPASAPIERRIVKHPGICLGLPVFHRIDVPFVQCLLETLGRTQIIAFVDFLPGDSLVSRARNNLVGRFLDGHDGFDEAGKPIKTLHDWLLFLDSDLTFRPEHVQMLYDLGVARGVGIYCGTYPIKQIRPKIVINTLPGLTPGEDGTVKVREAGTGFMLIHREVFERMRERFREEIEFIADTGDNREQKGWDFFSVGVRKDIHLERKRYLSEDWYFCQRWREMGGDIILQTKIQCGHIGQFTYPGNPIEIVAAAEIHRKALERMKGGVAQGGGQILVRTIRSLPEAPVANNGFAALEAAGKAWETLGNRAPVSPVAGPP